MRILHLPVVAGRQAWGLSRAERRAGHQSDFIAFEQILLQFPADRILFQPGDSILQQEMKRWQLFLSCIFRYDIFHFHFGQKFFNLFPRPWKTGDSLPQAMFRFAYWLYSLIVGRLDIWVLKALGKKIFMTYHGDDIRQGDRSLKLYEFSIAQAVDTEYYNAYSDRRKRRMGRYYQKVCEQVYVVSPDLLTMAPVGSKLLHYTGVDAKEWLPSANRSASSRLKIVHAPSHRLVKGTRFIEDAIQTLRKEGYDFEYITVEKITNAEAKKIYANADVVIDQLLAGWYGVFAVELMAMETPVIAYIRDEDLAKEPREFQDEFPIIRSSPTMIEQTLRQVLEGKMNLAEIGARSRQFTEKWYNADHIAAEVLKDYENA